jgi:ADP-ribose pyrophosphatase YjhB (NUDIX family)
MSEAEYYKSLPKKRMGAGAVILDEEDRILIVKPSYKDHWSVPGGIVEENESPRAACIREVKEEIGIDAKIADFVGVAYRSDQDHRGDSLQFVFFCGKLKKEEISAIRVDGKEIVEYKFVTADDALPLLNKPLAVRLKWGLEAMKKGERIYFEYIEDEK